MNAIKLPLWKSCLDKMRSDGMTYCSHWKAEFFEEHLRCNRDTDQFVFEMLELKQEIEEEDGFYFRQIKNGQAFEIPPAAEHEIVAKTFERKLRRYAVRSISIRSATLSNPQAQLTECERKRMDHNLEQASIRLLLLSRQKSIENVLKERKPQLLEK